jgi:hypothetical protein
MNTSSKRTDDEDEKRRLQIIAERNRVAISHMNRSGAFRINPNWTKPPEKQQEVKEPGKPE